MPVELQDVSTAAVFGWWLLSILSHASHGQGEAGSGAGLNTSTNSTVTFEFLPGLYGVIAASGLIFLVVITLLCCTMILTHGRILPQKAKVTLHKLRQLDDTEEVPDPISDCSHTELVSHHTVSSPPQPSTRATTTEDRHTDSMSPDNGVLLVSKQTTV